jgi:hypothetical protein
MLKDGPLAHFFPALAGRIEADTLNTAFEKYLDDGEFSILSGDYKGATDTLRKDVSLRVIRGLIEGLPDLAVGVPAEELDDYKRLLEMCLTEHEIEYGFKGKKGWEEGEEPVDMSWKVRQRRGQLMGSFLSFPVLNIVNLAINLAFMEKKGMITVEDWRDAPLLVNGDDVSAIGPPGVWDDEWEEFVRLAGFVKSLGKNYVADSFCTINTQLFVVEPATPSSPARLREELLTPFHHLYSTKWSEMTEYGNGQEESLRGPQAAGTLLKRLCDHLVTEEDKELWTRVFLRLRLPDLKRIGLPWYLPGDYGGFGIVPHGTLQAECGADARLTAHLALSFSCSDTKFTKVQNPIAMGSFAEKRPCDKVRAAIDMKYLKALGWVQYAVTDPPPELLDLHDSRPKAPGLDPLGLLLTGFVPEGFETPARHLAKRRKALRKAQGHSTKRKDLIPSNLSKEHRLLWLPRSTVYTLMFQRIASHPLLSGTKP